ncbi:MAG: glutamyl-tRNA reductase [Acidobacteriota bacterium]
MSGAYSCPHQDVCRAVPAHLHFHDVARFSGLAALRVLTISHRAVGLADLPTLSVTCDGGMGLHAELSARNIESVVLTTCNRTELYWRARVPGDDEAALEGFARALGTSGERASRVSTRFGGEAAATHLFRVCAGLESLVIGEAEILGQVRKAREASAGAGAFLDGVFKAALRTGRLARAETRIGVGALSVASTAVHWLAGVMPLAERRVVVVGAGDTGAKAARQLRAMGVGQLVIANRTVERAAGVANSLGAESVGLDALAGELARADALVCAASGSEWLVTARDLRAAAAARPSRPMVIVDLAVPGGVEPADIEGVTRIGLSGLEHLVEEHRRHREGEVPAVEALIKREIEWLRGWARHQALRPLVSELRQKVETIRRTELARAQDGLRGSQIFDAGVLDRLSRRLLDQVLAIPLAALEAGDLPLDATHAEYLRRLFALDTEATRCA